MGIFDIITESTELASSVNESMIAGLTNLFAITVLGTNTYLLCDIVPSKYPNDSDSKS